MLYDHEKDPDENENIAELATYSTIVDKLHNELHRSYRSNIYGN